jgi:hypothetical protein
MGKRRSIPITRIMATTLSQALVRRNIIRRKGLVTGLWMPCCIDMMGLEVL